MVLLVYFASIADNLRVFTGIMSGASVLSLVIYSMMRDGGNTSIKLKHFILSISLAVIFGLVCALLPTTEEVYKIAGVAGQEKAIISVTGQPTTINHVEVVKP